MIAHDPDGVFANTDIYVAAYPTPKQHGTMTIGDLESNLLTRLQADNVFSGHKEVILVGHSMGGLLIQQILLTYRDQELYKKVRAIFLYGTPQEGSDLANWAKYFNRDPKLDELQAGDRNFTLHDLDQSWIHAGFPKITRYCAYETKKENGFKVVDSFSATRGCDDYAAIDANHRDLVKPCDTTADAYIFLKAKLKQMPIVTETSATNLPPAVVVRQTPLYEQASRLLDRINNINRNWQGGIEYIQRQFIGPYKMGGRGPIPSNMPENLVEELAESDRATTFDFRSLETDLSKFEASALDCMQLVPNEERSQQTLYGQAVSAAEKPTTIPNLQSGKADSGRYSEIISYFSQLQEKLGDYHCTVSK